MNNNIIMNTLGYDIIYSYYQIGAYIISALLITIVEAGRSWNQRRLLII